MIELRHDQLILRGMPVADVSWRRNANPTEVGIIQDKLNSRDYDDAFDGDPTRSSYEMGYDDGGLGERANIIDFLEKYFEQHESLRAEGEKLLEALEKQA